VPDNNGVFISATYYAFKNSLNNPYLSLHIIIISPVDGFIMLRVVVILIQCGLIGSIYDLVRHILIHGMLLNDKKTLVENEHQRETKDQGESRILDDLRVKDL